MIDISGKNQNFQGSSNSESTIRTAVQIGQRTNLPVVPTGNSGNLTISTPVLNIGQEAVISVENQGSGSAGILTIKADNLNLEEAGNITAAAESGIGGNILLNTQNLNIGNDSQITAEANNDGDGGNITIDTSNLIAKKNAQVTANASRGRGGNILVNTRGLFLFDSPENIFTASSEFGLDGIITIDSPANNFPQNIETSEVEIVTIPDFFTPRCQNPDRAKLTIDSGQYLPANPHNYYSYPTSSVELPPELAEKIEQWQRKLEANPETNHQSTLMWQLGEPIVNATEIVETEDGKVFLVSPQAQTKKALSCGQMK